MRQKLTLPDKVLLVINNGNLLLGEVFDCLIRNLPQFFCDLGYESCYMYH